MQVNGLVRFKLFKANDVEKNSASLIGRFLMNSGDTFFRGFPRQLKKNDTIVFNPQDLTWSEGYLV